MRAALASICLLAGTATAQPPADLSAGRRMIEAYFRAQVKQIADGCLAGVTTKATLADALSLALKRTGYVVSKSNVTAKRAE